MIWLIGVVVSFSGLAVYNEFAAWFPNRSGSEVVYLEQAFPRPKFFFPITFAVITVLLSFSASNSLGKRFHATPGFASFTLQAFRRSLRSVYPDSSRVSHHKVETERNCCSLCRRRVVTCVMNALHSSVFVPNSHMVHSGTAFHEMVTPHYECPCICQGRCSGLVSASPI